MDFEQIKQEIKKIELDAVRADNEHYFEGVVKKVSLGALTRVLETIFGPCAWPSRNKLSKDVEKLANEFGGVRKDQALYCISPDSPLIIAMLWPWQDGERVTLKMAKG